VSDKLYTIRELAGLLNIPESNVRYYRNKWPEYFPHQGDGRNKRYEAGAVDALRIIAEGMNRKETATEIEKALRQALPMFLESEQEPQTSVATTQQQAQQVALLAISEQLGRIADQQDRIERLEQERNEQQQQIDSLENQIQQLREEIKKTQRRTLWQRLRGTDPNNGE